MVYEVVPPFIVNSASLHGTGNLRSSKQDLFKLEDELGSLPGSDGGSAGDKHYRGEILDASDLPIR